MMTNKEKLENLLREFDVEFTSNDVDTSCLEGDKKVDGYSGFYVDFKFDLNGKFIKMEILE